MSSSSSVGGGSPVPVNPTSNEDLIQQEIVLEEQLLQKQEDERKALANFAQDVPAPKNSADRAKKMNINLNKL